MENILLNTGIKLLILLLAFAALYIFTLYLKVKSSNKYYKALLQNNGIAYSLEDKSKGKIVKKNDYGLIVTTMYDSYEVLGRMDMENFLKWYQNEMAVSFILLPVKDGCFIIHRKDIVEVRCYGEATDETSPWITAILPSQ